jgi:arginine repressor
MSAQFFQQFIIALLEHSPDLYLDEIQEQLDEQHGIHVSLSTISRTLKRIGITSKKVSYNIDTLFQFLYSETHLAL